MERSKQYEWYAREFSEKVLNWAVRKAGNRADGADLAQEVFLQLFTALNRHESIDQPERFTWKVARYVWCNHMRELKKNTAMELSDVIPDGTDFAGDYADREALQASLSRMRLGIANLNRLQREMIVLHYLNGFSVRDVARRLNVTESSVTWHLFCARKQVREDICMKDERSTVYRPGRLSVGYSGEAPAYPDTAKLSDSLIRQNICLLCPYGKTLDELAMDTGVPKPFLEYDVDWLCEHEFLKLEGKKYYTRFLILNQAYFANRSSIYTSTRKEYIDVIISELWNREKQIRDIGFYGSDFPAAHLYWQVIMMFTSFCSRHSELMLRLKNRDRAEIRADGGKYFVVAADRSDGKTGFSHLEPAGWNDFCGIFSDSCQTDGQGDSYYWLGVYTFAAEAYHPEIVRANPETRRVIHGAYCKAVDPDFSPDRLSPEEQEKLALAVEAGYILKWENRYIPQYSVFTREQLSKLQNDVFAPLLEIIAPRMEALAKRFALLHKEDFPKASECGVDRHVYMDLWDFCIFTYKFAAEAGKLALPALPEQGVPLNLVMIR